MECFNDVISVRDLCSAPTNEPILYMDDVGISYQDMDAFYPKAYSSVEDYFTKRYAFAVKSLQGLVYAHFQNKFLATSLVDDHRIGVYGNSQVTQAGSNYQGIQLEFNSSDVYYQFEISEVSLRLNHTGDVDVKVYDLLQDELLDEITIAAETGKINTGFLNKVYYSAKRPMNLFVGYDADGIESVNTPVKSGLCCGRKSCSNSYLSATGVEVDGAFLNDNTTTLNHTGGLSLVYSITCDHVGWLCAYPKQVALPLAYKLGEIMLSDALQNSGGERATNNHTVNREELEYRYNWYQAKFNDAFSSVLGNMKLPSNRCFQCNTPVRHKAFAI